MDLPVKFSYVSQGFQTIKKTARSVHPAQGRIYHCIHTESRGWNSRLALFLLRSGISGAQTGSMPTGEVQIYCTAWHQETWKHVHGRHEFWTLYLQTKQNMKKQRKRKLQKSQLWRCDLICHFFSENNCSDVTNNGRVFSNSVSLLSNSSIGNILYTYEASKFVILPLSSVSHGQRSINLQILRFLIV